MSFAPFSNRVTAPRLEEGLLGFILQAAQVRSQLMLRALFACLRGLLPLAAGIVKTSDRALRRSSLLMLASCVCILVRMLSGHMRVAGDADIG